VLVLARVPAAPVDADRLGPNRNFFFSYSNFAHSPFGRRRGGGQVQSGGSLPWTSYTDVHHWRRETVLVECNIPGLPDAYLPDPNSVCALKAKEIAHGSAIELLQVLGW
jgi:hypothetical protein